MIGTTERSAAATAAVRACSPSSVHVVTSIARDGGGLAYSIPALCSALARSGLAVELNVLEGRSEEGFAFDLITHRASFLPGMLGISRSMHDHLSSAVERADIVHNHSLWRMPNVYPAWVTRDHRCRLVSSPRGTLSPQALRFSRLRKRVMWTACQRRVIERAALVHATAESEYRDVRNAGYRGPVAIIPNGTDLPTLAPAARPATGRRRLLYLGRVHPIKGLDVLLRAWRRLEREAPEWELVIAGQAELGYGERLRELASELALERVEFRGPVYGAAKSELLFGADVFVLPSRSENFGMVVAEALAHGAPVVVSKNAPWKGVRERGCGWWVELSDDALTAALREALGRSPSELTEAGRRGREWIEHEHSWARIAEMMRSTYEWTLGGGTPPPWVECR